MNRNPGNKIKTNNMENKNQSSNDQSPLQVEEGIVKLSLCGVCGGIVRVAVKHYLDSNTKARNEFKNEVMEHNLLVKEQPLIEYQKENTDWCKCKTKTHE